MKSFVVQCGSIQTDHTRMDDVVFDAGSNVGLEFAQVEAEVLDFTFDRIFQTGVSELQGNFVVQDKCVAIRIV